VRMDTLFYILDDSCKVDGLFFTLTPVDVKKMSFISTLKYQHDGNGQLIVPF